MEKERIEEIKERLSKIDAYPWKMVPGDSFCACAYYTPANASAEDSICIGFSSNSDHNAVFIGAAPNDIEWLLDTITKLREALRGIIGDVDCGYKAHVALEKINGEGK